ncbi:MAG: zinc ribbon domain-containing protein, partial [Methanomassiliicoccales archaeon]
MKCRRCGNDNSEDALFCSKCGGEMPKPVQPKQEPWSGEPVKEIERMVEVPAGYKLVRENNSLMPPKPRKTSAMIIGVCVIIAAVIIAAAVLISSDTDGGSDGEDGSGEFGDGSYLIYDATYLNDGEITTNQIKLSYSNFTSSSCTLTFMIVGDASSASSTTIAMDEETGMISIGGALIGNTTDTVGTNMGTGRIET